MFSHDCPLAVKPASTPRRLVQKKKKNLERFSTYWCSPFCCVCLGCCAAEFGNSGGTYELPCICLSADLLFRPLLSFLSLSYYRDENGDPPLPSWILLFTRDMCHKTRQQNYRTIFPCHLMWCNLFFFYFNSVIIKPNYYLIVGYELVCSIVGMVVGGGGGNNSTPGSCFTP